ncbi:MAG: DUF1304 domain-containing protein [Salinibacterium sp.]|nr:DUF1304 domain-containing protein [Salinibacterium sp.]
MSALTIVGSVFIFIAALIHLAIFFMESVFFSRPAVWKRFGMTSQESADIVKPMAFNQGFYNVFLAIGGGIGLVMIGSPAFEQAGFGISLFAASSMVAAALVLISSSPSRARAALVQGMTPLVGILFLVLSIVVG